MPGGRSAGTHLVGLGQYDAGGRDKPGDDETTESLPVPWVLAVSAPA